MKKSMHHHNNFIAIIFGSATGMFNYIMSNPNVTINAMEFFKVFLMGVIGGTGGYIGKIVIHQIAMKFKRLKKE
jgi:hypothetical protein